MYYFSKQTIVNSIEMLKNNIPSKFIGLLSILRSIKTDGLRTNETYKIKDSFIGDWLNDIMMLEDVAPVESESTLYVRFANGWSEYVSDTMFSANPKLYALIVFIYKFEGFVEKPTNENLLKLFIEDFHLSLENVNDWFDKSVIQIDYSDNKVDRTSLKNELHLTYSTLTFEGGYSVKAKASELSRAPFIQTLYAGMDSMKCLLVSRTDLEYLYPSKMECSKQLDDFVSRQIIYYGAPGTGKSHRIKKQLEGVSKENIFRTTFHPDSDYSTFVGAYKPTKAKKPLYGLNGGLTVRLNDGKDDLDEDIITYKFIPQAFINAYMQAYRKPNENVYLIIEEINRGNCAQIFGDLFQLLDRDENGKSEYTIKADADLKAFLEDELSEEGKEGLKDGELCLPSNLYIYATMNTSDQSLFPIDSAFKRRWDWEYEPIKYKNTDWVIDVDGLKYRWSDFQKEVNARILKDTGSEDKMLGDYFVNPPTRIISYNLFRNKILFYLWNDVCKDSDADIFPTDEDFSFSKLYDEDSKRLIVSMMDKLGLKPIDENGTEDNEDDMSEDDDNSTSSVRYSINGEETDEKGKAWGKGALVKRAVEIYCNNHAQDTAAHIRDVWMSENFIIPHIVETDEDREQRIHNSSDPNAEGRSKEIKLPNGESLHVSTQVGDGKQRKSFSDFLSKIKSRPEWGIDIQEL